MAKYKYANPEHTFINDLEEGKYGIHPGVPSEWQHVQKFIDEGGTVEDFETPAEVLVKATKNAEDALTKEKQEAKRAGVVVDGILFDTDELARLSYIEFMLKLMQNPSYTVAEWKASPGVWVVMDGVLFTKLIGAWEQKLTSIFSFVKTKEDEFRSKSTVEDIKAVNVKYTGV